MSKERCCVPNCNKTRSDDTILHLFPNPAKDLDRFLTWINVTGGDISSLDHETIYRCRRVCHKHFESQYHTRSKRLSCNAVPTIHLNNDITQPLVDITNRRSPVNDSRTPQSILPATATSSNYSQPTIPSAEPPPTLFTTSIQKSLNKDNIRVSEAFILAKKVKKLQKDKDSAMTRLKKALKLSENPSFIRAMKSFSTAATIFTTLQFRESGKNKMGRRYNKKEKIMALALYKQGPRAYRWLRKFFALPSPLTLSRMISRASLKPGINDNLFAQLKKRVTKMKNNEKLCVVLFDEVALKPHFDYSRRKDYISGFVCNGTETKKIIADHALVFMLRGIFKNYKQAIAYSFCASSTPKLELVQQIKNIIKKLQDIGLKVIGTICDQGTSNVSAINWLINETRQQYLRRNLELKHKVFEIGGNIIVPLYDPPHLIKGIRNNLITKDLTCHIDGQSKTAKWDHILKLYDENPAYQGIRLMPKLTERHVVPEKISKMKVKCATQVFSHSVAANMGYLASNGILPEECKETADVLIFFDSLFDSMNGSYDNWKKRSGKPLLGPVKPGSPHKGQWAEAKNILKSMKFKNKNGKSGTVPSIINWIQTIENTEFMVELLSKEYGLTSLWMRHFNQDPLENFFGCIRSHGYRNTSPTCSGFEAAFASLLINNLSSVHSPGSNCEVDSCKVFRSLSTLFFKESPNNESSHTTIDFDDISSEILQNVNIKIQNVKIKGQLEFVTGYVLKKLKVKKCPTCHDNFYNKAMDSSAISFREYFKNKRLLTYPSPSIRQCFSNIQDVVTNVLKKDASTPQIRQYMKTILTVIIDYNFIMCDIHKREIIKKLEDISLNLFIYNWCKDTNKLLNGSRTDYNAHDRVQQLAFNYFVKRGKNKV